MSLSGRFALIVAALAAVAGILFLVAHREAGPSPRANPVEATPSPAASPAAAVSRPAPIAALSYADAEEAAWRAASPDAVRSIIFCPPVKGRVLVSGEVPREPIPLKIDDYMSQNPRWTTTDANGAFEFSELSVDFGGRLEFPSHFCFESEAESMTHRNGVDIQPPTEFLELRLVQRNAITGRLTSGAKPVAAKSVRVKSIMTADGGSYPAETAKRIGEGGLFSVIVPDDAKRVDVTIIDDLDLCLLTIAAEGPFAGVRKLGDIEVPVARRIELRVRDDTGKAVEGAVASIADSRASSTPTDPDGRTSILAPNAPCRLVVNLVGYATTSTDVPEPGSNAEVLEIKLARVNRLRITVRIADGTFDPSRLVLVAIGRKEDEVVERPDGSDEDLPTPRFEAGELHPWSVDFFKFEIIPDSDGTAVLGNFTAEAHLVVRLLGARCHEELHRQEVVMDGTTWKDVALVSAVAPWELAGVVENEKGDPVEDAMVTPLTEAELERGGELTSAQGRFRIRGIFADRLAVEISGDGSQPVRVPVSRSMAGIPQKLVLPTVKEPAPEPKEDPK